MLPECILLLTALSKFLNVIIFSHCKFWSQTDWSQNYRAKTNIAKLNDGNMNSISIAQG